MLPTIEIKPLSDHTSEIALLGVMAVGVLILMGWGQHDVHLAIKAAIAAGKDADSIQRFDPSAYLVLLTLIAGAIKERWTQRSADRANANLAASNQATTT